ncbi:hypothetical protein RR48_13048 [Papilio machaon]|uniref:Uncharacterized protein n=1 Tax=Papilio machaon TaxID=76193 RepID=A0A194QSL5_PAPMA|nr:hypothetical protein RR48_13048 [Papilio machaon]
MGLLWVILFSASTGLLLIQGLPVRPTPQVYPHGTNEAAVLEGWRPQGLYMLPVLALVITALGLLFGCTWCYRHKDCKTAREPRYSHIPIQNTRLGPRYPCFANTGTTLISTQLATTTTIIAVTI